MKPLVSVVVPAYNAERYLRECLLSLKNQSYSSLEFICINDGSTDGTLSILERFNDKDNRFKIISQKNKGYGAACNAGLNAAKGEYIALFEADDFCDSKFYETLVTIASDNKCDFVKSDFYKYWNANRKIYTFILANAKELYNLPIDTKKAFEITNLYEMQPSVWSAIYRRELLDEIRFLETPGAAYQDTSFTVKTIAKAERLYFVNQAFVNYRQHKGQSVRSIENVYAVCDEFANIEKTIPLTAGLLAFKFHTYLWNYRRVDFQYKLEFLLKATEEFRSVNKNLVVESLYQAGDIDKLNLLIASPEGFHKKYEMELDFSRWNTIT